MKNHQICGCITCEQARDKGIAIATEVVKGMDLCPIGLLAIGQVISMMANELLTQHVLSTVWKENPRFDDTFFQLATHHTESLRNGVEEDVQQLLKQLPSDGTFVRAAAGLNHKGVAFPLEEYITEMEKARAALDAEEAKEEDPLVDVLSKLLGPGFAVTRAGKPD